MALDGLFGALQGFQQGMADGENRKYRQMELESRMKSQDEASARQKALDEYTKQKDESTQRASEFKMRTDLREKYTLPKLEQGQSIFDQDPASFEFNPEYKALMARKAQADSDPYGNKALQAELARQRLDEGRSKQVKENASPLRGYKKTDQYVGDPIEERTLRSAATDFDKFRDTMNSLKQRVKSASKQDLANPYSNASKAIKNDLKDLQLTYKGKAFAELGVLAGPDMAILDQIIEDPGGVSNLISGKQGVLDRYEQALGRVSSAFDSKVKTLGLMPDQGMMPPEEPQGGILSPKLSREENDELAQLRAMKAKGSKVANGLK